MTEHIPEEVAYGTTRLLRLRRIGRVYLLENNQHERDTAGALVDRWKVVARIDGPKARAEAFEALGDTNKRVAQMLRDNAAKRQEVSNG